MTTSSDWRRALLKFIPTEDYFDELIRLYRAGVRTFLIRPRAPWLEEWMTGHFSSSVVVHHEAPANEPVDAVVIPPMEGDALARELQTHFDRAVPVVAPLTDRHITQRSMFVVTLPKAGTHLLYHLLGEFGVESGGRYKDQLVPKTYYFVGQENSHMSAPAFFAALAREPQGGIHHPFFSLPALLIYRNPMDVVVSEAFYYGQRDRTALSRYFGPMSVSDRCHRLIQSDPLVDSIRNRILAYVPWLRLPNVIPVSYEELVGERGGGSLERQAQCIWSLQLKLQIPGSPLSFGERMYTEQSATFRKGRINGHKEHYEERHYRSFRALPQDFMHAFGYDVDDAFVDGYAPRLVDEFRRRPLVLEQEPEKAVA